MQEPAKRLSRQPALYLIILSLALFLRLYHLGSAPLSDFEARSALQARALLRGEALVPGPQPLTLMAQTAAFFLFGEYNFTARLLSALLGSLLCVLPWFWRRVLGERTALLLALGLACAPGLVAISRLAGGPAAALTLGAAALTAWYVAPGSALAGGLAGLFLLGGPWTWSGLLGAALAWGLARGSGVFSEMQGSLKGDTPQRARSAFLWGAAFSFLLGSTLFLRFPSGLSAFSQSLFALGRAAFVPSGVPFGRLLAVFFWQHLLAVSFAFVGAVLVWRNRVVWGRFALLWVLSALLVGLALAGRQVMDAAWALLPLHVLAAYGLNALLAQESPRQVAVWGFCALTVVLGGIAWLSMAGMPAGDLPLEATWQRWGLLAAVLMVWLISGFLTGLGWERAVPLRGGALGLTIFLGMVLLAQIWPGKPRDRMALWYPGPQPARLDLLTRTLGDAAEYANGRRDALQVRLDVDSPALVWALKDFSLTLASDSDVAAMALSPAVITPEQAASPDTQMVYRGQAFAWQVLPAWSGTLPPNATRWFIFGEMPAQVDHVTLWLRGDLFPGGVAVPVSQQPPADAAEPLTP